MIFPRLYHLTFKNDAIWRRDWVFSRSIALKRRILYIDRLWEIWKLDAHFMMKILDQWRWFIPILNILIKLKITRNTLVIELINAIPFPLLNDFNFLSLMIYSWVYLLPVFLFRNSAFGFNYLYIIVLCSAF